MKDTFFRVKIHSFLFPYVVDTKSLFQMFPIGNRTSNNKMKIEKIYIYIKPWLIGQDHRL